MGALLGLALVSFTFTRFGIGDANVLIKNFDETKWLALSAFVLLVVALIAGRRLEPVALRIVGFDFLLAGLFGWLAVSLAWAPDPNHGALIAVYGALLLALYAAARMVHPDAANTMIHGMALMAVTGSLVVPLVSGDMNLARGFGNPDFHAEFKVAALPLIFAFWNAGPTWLRALTRVVAVVGVIDLFGFASRLGGPFGSDLQFVAAAGLVLYFLFLFGRKWQIWAGAGLAAVGAGAVVAFVFTRGIDQVTGIAPSVLTRLQAWTNAVGMALEHPLRGWGAGGYQFSFPDFREYYFDGFDFLGAPVQSSRSAANFRLLAKCRVPAKCRNGAESGRSSAWGDLE